MKYWSWKQHGHFALKISFNLYAISALEEHVRIHTSRYAYIHAAHTSKP
jgi:hypothetical protein